MSENHSNRSEQIRQKHAGEWRSFHSFHDNICWLVKQRHKQELLKVIFFSQSKIVAAQHRRELAELAEAKALAFKLLQDEQNQEKARAKESIQAE